MKQFNSDSKGNHATEETKTSTSVERTARIHNLIILDESGSMISIFNPALSGLNETLQTIRTAQKKYPEQNQSVTLITFNSGGYHTIYSNIPAEEALDITPDRYRPNSGTPLFDAMGKSINDLRATVAKGDVVLVTVITDGYENDSREYSGNGIKCLIEKLKKEGWVFTYIGANQDLAAVANSLSIDNILEFACTDESTNAMFERENRARDRFYNRCNEVLIQCRQDYSSADLNEGYFDED